jgi:hypothetical protein
MPNNTENENNQNENNQTEPNLTGPNQTEQNQTGPNLTGPNLTGPNVTEQNQTGTNQTGPTVTEQNQTGTNQTGPTVTGPDSNLLFIVPNIINRTLDDIDVEDNVTIKTIQGTTDDGKEVTFVEFDTTNSLLDTQVKEKLIGVTDITVYNNENDIGTKTVLDEIKSYASQIKCENFHGKGTIDDYNELFIAASKIANESKQMKLDVDVEGFDDFSKAADELANLFTSFTLKLENVNIINDLDFLKSILNSLKKIVNLSNVFGKFKQTILGTSNIHIPKSAHDTSEILKNVLSEINCAMNYVTHFIEPSENPNLTDSELSSDEKNVIKKAITTIDNWKDLCEQGVAIALTNDDDIKNIKNVNNEFKLKTSSLNTLTNKLKLKLSVYNFNK